jgi:TraC-like protein
MAARQRARESVTAIQQELVNLQRRMAEAEQREGERLGKLAIETGLARLGLDDKTVREEFQKIAARFQKAEGASPGQPAGSRRKPSRKHEPSGQPAAGQGAHEPALGAQNDAAAAQ